MVYLSVDLNRLTPRTIWLYKAGSQSKVWLFILGLRHRKSVRSEDCACGLSDQDLEETKTPQINIDIFFFLQDKNMLINRINGYPASTQRRNNVVATSRRCCDVVTTLLGRCVFAGYILEHIVYPQHVWQSKSSGLTTFIQRRLNVDAPS